MDAWEEESQGDPSRVIEEALFPPLNLLFTPTPELIKSIETALQQDYSSLHQKNSHYTTEYPNTLIPQQNFHYYTTEHPNTLIPQQNFHYTTESHPKTLTPSETPKNHEKPKAVSSQIYMISIGLWTHVRVYPDDIKAKFYFAKRKVIWEILDDVETGTQVERLKRKIEIQWSDILSFRASFNSNNEILEVELRKRPTFFMETNPQAGKHTQWKMDQDFTTDQSASKYRRHTLHFFPGDLKKTLGKLFSGDRFWSELAKVSFPTLQSPYFDFGFGSDDDNVVTINVCDYGYNQTLSLDDDDDEFIHHYPQGFGQLPDPDVNVNFNIPTQFNGNDGRQMNSSVQGIYLPWTQVIQPSTQLIEGRYVRGQQFNNPMIQTRNTRELRGNQAYAQALRETKANYMMFQMESYLQDSSAHEGQTQNMEHIHMDGNFQTNKHMLL